MKEVASRSRRFTQPHGGETLEAIAARALPERPRAEAVRDLESWNPHVVIRLGRGGLLPSDVIFLEPPLPR
jgi:hypothetical protein